LVGLAEILPIMQFCGTK